jgi:hypothetical protein
MTPTPYNAKRKGSNGPSGSTGAREQVTIPNAHALGETAKALRCDFGDNADHWIPKSQIAPGSEVKRRGDRGRLVVQKWWAAQAGVLDFARRPSPWAQMHRTRDRLRELDATLAKDHPARAIVKTICDAIRADLGATRETRRGGGDGGGHANSETR